MALPGDADLLDELLTVRLRESAPGVYRLDHDTGQRDDRAVSLGLGALALTEQSDGSAVIVWDSPAVADQGMLGVALWRGYAARAGLG